MEMDDMYYKNQELSTLLESKIDHPVKHTATVRGIYDASSYTISWKTTCLQSLRFDSLL